MQSNEYHTNAVTMLERISKCCGEQRNSVPGSQLLSLATGDKQKGPERRRHHDRSERIQQDASCGKEGSFHKDHVKGREVKLFWEINKIWVKEGHKIYDKE